MGVPPPQKKTSSADLAYTELGQGILAFTEDKIASSYILESLYDSHACFPCIDIFSQKPVPSTVNSVS